MLVFSSKNVIDFVADLFQKKSIHISSTSLVFGNVQYILVFNKCIIKLTCENVITNGAQVKTVCGEKLSFE